MYTCYIQSFKILASFCSWAGWFESYLLENPQRRVFAWCGSCDGLSLFLILVEWSLMNWPILMPNHHKANKMIQPTCPSFASSKTFFLIFGKTDVLSVISHTLSHYNPLQNGVLVGCTVFIMSEIPSFRNSVIQSANKVLHYNFNTFCPILIKFIPHLHHHTMRLC